MNSRSFRASKIRPYQPSKENMKSLWILITAGITASAMAADKVDVSKLPPAAKQQGVTYAKDIKPIFEKSCVKCHGPEKQKGKIRVDSLEATLKDGEHGPIVVKGKSADSSLVHSVARLNEDEAMPPEGKGDPLTKEQVGLIRAWIDQGAK
ncbi:MAG: c-type cytochrome [Verrucomicrobiales bacterium]|nr:c-type cytochrome [Verrucomicrobiales bacterium]